MIGSRNKIKFLKKAIQTKMSFNLILNNFKEKKREEYPIFNFLDKQRLVFQQICSFKRVVRLSEII